jgi:hypothetical protein
MRDHDKIRSENKNNFSTSTFLQCLSWYFLIKLVVTLPTQPIAVAQTQKQKNPDLNFFKTIKTVSKVGAFKGLSASLFREFFKLLYKGPLLLGAKDISNYLITNYYPEEFHNNKTVVNFTASMIVAGSDTVLSVIPDRIATFYKASDAGADKGFYSYLKTSKGPLEIFNKLTKGFTPYLMKQSVLTTALFFGQDWAKSASITFFPENERAQLAFTTAVGPILPAISSAPFDVIKTWMQMPGASKKSVYNTCTDIIKQHGLKGATAGVGWKLALTYTGYSINTLGLTLYQRAQEKHISDHTRN